MKDQTDSEMLKEAMADAKTLREVAKENAFDYLREAFTPKIRQVVADQLQREAEEEMEGDYDEEDMEDMEDEEEVEMDLDDEEEEDEEEEEEEEEEDMEESFGLSERDWDNIANFLSELDEEVAGGERHRDPDLADELSYDEIQHDGGHEDAPMLDVGDHEDGYGAMAMDDVHEKLDLDRVVSELEEDIEERDLDRQIDEFLNDLENGRSRSGGSDVMYEIDVDELESTLREYGVTSVDRDDPMQDPSAVSGPYDQVVDDLMDTSDDYTEFDYGYEYGQMDYEAEDMPDSTIDESYVSYGDLLLEEEEEDMEEMDYDEMEDEDEMEESYFRLRRENEKLKEQLNEFRQAFKILREEMNEVNLINSKLLYTNKLTNAFDLNERQKKRVIDSFDRAQNIREVKLTYTNLAENLTDSASQSSQQTKKDQAESLTEQINLSSSRQQGSTRPSSNETKQILNEDASFPERMKKLAGIKNR
jgi:hypothetical protein